MTELEETPSIKKDPTTTNPPPSIDPVEFAAKEFNMGIKPFISALDRFSKKELIRVMAYIVASPLETTPKFVDKRAKYLADLGNHLLVCKMLMMQEVYKTKSKETKNERTETQIEVDPSGRDLEEQKGQSLSESKE